jgi:predicted acyltransferase
MLPPRAEPSAPAVPTPEPVATTAAPVRRERLVSLDAFRGLTVAGMLLVNDPGSWGAIYPPLEHATWHGWTPTDLIFPFFLFIVGITTQLSLGARRAQGADDGEITRQVLRRGALIFLFGLLLNWFPGFQWDAIPHVASPSFADRVVYRLEHLRFMGVLQRIGLAYIISATIATRATLKQQVVILACMLYGYWFLMTLVPVPPHGMVGQLVLSEPGHTLDAWLDRVLLTPNHLWVGGDGLRDPEGLLSTIPAAGTALLGNFVGRWIGRREVDIHERLSAMFAGGALGMMGGLMWNWSFPINKSLWTSSYTLFCAGMACVALATVIWLVDVQKWSAWAKPFLAFGLNPMLAFVGSGLVARTIYSIMRVDYGGRRVSPVEAIYQTFVKIGFAPKNASLLFALCFVGVFYVGLRYAQKKGYVFKV